MINFSLVVVLWRPLASCHLPEYFRGMFLSGMQGGLQENELGEVSAGAFRVVFPYLYTAELPESGEGGAGAGGGREDGGRGGGEGGGGKGKGEGCRRKRDKNTGGTGRKQRHYRSWSERCSRQSETFP